MNHTRRLRQPLRNPNACRSFILHVVFAAGAVIEVASLAHAEPEYREEMVFPLNPQHNHAPGIVECPNGDLLASWYRGSGERRADDVVMLGARLKKGRVEWSEPFLMADYSEFPDCNTCMMIDKHQKLWVFWPIILDNEWDSALTNYRVSSDYEGAGAPKWEWQGVIFLKPRRFQGRGAGRCSKQRMASIPPEDAVRIKGYEKHLEAKLSSSKLSQRMGWQPRCKPTVLSTGRILLPLYSDTFSFSIMAISDDDGQNWYASSVLMGFGNIQPAVLERKDGSLVAYMRENGPLNKIRVCESTDQGLTWGKVGTIDLPNPGSGLDAVRVGKRPLGADLQRHDRQGATAWPCRSRKTRARPGRSRGTWKSMQTAVTTTRPSSKAPTARCTPSTAISSSGGERRMKHAAFNEDWIRAGDGK